MKHLDLQIKEFSQQFTDQLKSLESRAVVDCNILNNALELYKRRAAIEQDYADSLLRLSSSVMQRNKSESQKRPKWKTYSPTVVLNSLLASTEHIARAHKNLGDIYGKQMTQRVIDMQDDCVRLTKRSTDILQRRHVEILQSFNQLVQKQKNYTKLFNDTEDWRRKLDKVLDQLDREVVKCQSKSRECDKNIKIKKLKNEYNEKNELYKAKQIETTSARNRYILHHISLKDAIVHFYTNELRTIVQCSQYSFHNNLTRLSINHGSCEEALFNVHDSISKLFNTTNDRIDIKIDTDVFYGVHKTIFTLKDQIHITPAKDDNISSIVSTDEKVRNDLTQMLNKFEKEMIDILTSLEDKRLQIDAVANSYNELINQADFDVVEYICNYANSDLSVKDRSTSLLRVSAADHLYLSIQRKIKEPKLKEEASYFKLMEEYLNCQIDEVNIAAKITNVKTVLNNPTCDVDSTPSRKCSIQTQTAVMVGFKTKLFGGDLKKYSAESREHVPVVVKSCIRLISLYGMSNIGVFRVPGSQYDIQTFKTQFEHGLDPIKDLTGSTNDVNTAASLLKLYFRELEPPIFDEGMFNEMVDKYTTVKQNEEAIVIFMKDIVFALHPAVYATLAYLMSFLSHLSEFSAKNCMDIQNLAIIFGPCLMPIPEKKNNQLFHYQAIINHITQCLITYRDDLFTRQSEGLLYRKNHSLTFINEPVNQEARSALPIAESPFFDDGFPDVKKDSETFKRNESDRFVWSKPPEEQLFGRRSSESEKNRNLPIFGLTNSNAKLDHLIPEIIEDSVLLTKSFPPQFANDDIPSSVDRDLSSKRTYYHSKSISSNVLNEEPLNAESMAISDPAGDYMESVSMKCESFGKRSLLSLNSDSDAAFTSHQLLSYGFSTRDISDISDVEDSASLDNVVNVRSDIEDENESEVVKIRMGSVVHSIDLPESMDSLDDDDLRQTMQGLQKIEKLNVLRHRSTILIDKGLLTSKFISPLWSDCKQCSVSNSYTEQSPDVTTDEVSPVLPSSEISQLTLHASNLSLSKQGTVAPYDNFVSTPTLNFSKPPKNV